MKFNEYFKRHGACIAINKHSASAEYICFQNKLHLHKGQIIPVRIKYTAKYPNINWNIMLKISRETGRLLVYSIV